MTRWRRVVSVAFFFSTTYGSAYSGTPAAAAAAAAVHRHYFFHKTHRSRHRSILQQFRLLAPDHKKEGSRLLRFLLLANNNTDHGQSAEDGDTGGDYFGNRDKGKDNEGLRNKDIYIYMYVYVFQVHPPPLALACSSASVPPL